MCKSKDDGDANDCDCDDNVHAQCKKDGVCTLRKRNCICVMGHIGACRSPSSFVSVHQDTDGDVMAQMIMLL